MQSFTTLFALITFCAGSMALSITSPSADSYWVQFTTNTIAWASGSGDPTSVTLQIINPSKSFNGPFSIAEYVKTSLKSYDVTNVQLAVLDGYKVQMVDPLNNTIVLATSAPFSVKVSGTTPASVTYAPGTNPDGSSASNKSTSNQTMSNTTAASNSNSFKNNGTAANAKSPAARSQASLTSALALGASAVWSLLA